MTFRQAMMVQMLWCSMIVIYLAYSYSDSREASMLVVSVIGAMTAPHGLLLGYAMKLFQENEK